MKKSFKRRAMARAAVAAISVAAVDPTSIASAQDAGRYVTGDFHNHTTCSDGTLSLQKLVDKSVNAFDLDWFAQVGHGGNSARNCTLAEDPFEPVPPALGLTAPPTIPAGGQPAASGHGPNQTWASTLPGGAADIKGDNVFQSGVRSMWKWQEIQEFIYPVLEQEAHDLDKPIFTGLEQNVPGHEHCSTMIIDGQLPETGTGNANAQSQYEYCFDRSDNDRSRGASNQWDCSVPGSSNNGLLDATAKKIIVAGGAGSGNAGHVKTVEGVKWMNALSPNTSVFVPAHLERAGAFNPNGNNGYNVEHLRDFNNAAPEIAFGFESMPGHQADPDRGSYSRGAVGGGTYGGTGVYAAAVGGVWDALLGEGRHWWFFASSDYHNRGSFGPDQRESTADFLPGEYTKNYSVVKTAGKLAPQAIVDGLRSGDNYVANGQLIDKMAVGVCIIHGNGDGDPHLNQVENAAANGVSFNINNCATMGGTLSIAAGDDIILYVAMHDPEGTNNSPYSFPNPSLAQISVSQPLNAPVLDHVDVITGKVTGKVDPSDTAHYAGLLGSPAATNPSAALVATFNNANWNSKAGGWRSIAYRINAVTANMYLRVRGTNLPPATPFETDSAGNPLLDFAAEGKIPCADAACPPHMRTTSGGSKTSSFDVGAWADLWFYSNPVFVSVAPKK